MTKLRVLQARGGKGERIAFALLALVLSALEIMPSVNSFIPATTAIWLVVGYGVLALVGWFPAVAGFLYLALAASLVLVPMEPVAVGFPMLGTFAVLTMWIARGWFIAGAVALASSAIAGVSSTEPRLVTIAGALLGSVVALTVGLSLRMSSQRIARLKVQAEDLETNAKRAEELVRQEISKALHDTLVTDLARIIIVSRSLAQETLDPKGKRDAQVLADVSSEAMSHLRALIQTHRPRVQQASQGLASRIDHCRSMLLGNRIELIVEGPADLDAIGSQRQRELLSSVVREATVNAFKYATRDSAAYLSIETPDNGSISLTWRNDLPPEPTDLNPEISGGFGLPNLASLVGAQGGRIEYGSAGANWLVAVVIPSDADIARAASDSKLETDIDTQ